MAERRVVVDRLDCRVAVTAGGENPFAVRDRIERIARRDLAAAFADLAPALFAGDQSVYRLREIHLDFGLDAATPENAATDRWSRLLAAGVARTIATNDANAVRRFASPTAYLAAFLRDLVDGVAWSRWWYDEFRVLDRLPAAAIAVHLLAGRPGQIAPVLDELGRSGHLDRLVEGWDERDLGRLWTALALPLDPPVAAELAAHRALDVLAELGEIVPLTGAVDRLGRLRDRFRLWVALLARDRALAHNPATAGTVRALVDLAAVLKTRSDLAPALLTGAGLYPAALRELAEGALADAVGWLSALPAGGAELLARVAAAGRASPTSAPTRWASSVGGVFLLAIALAESGLWDHWRRDLGEAAARRCLRVVALKALGRDRAQLHQDDRALLLFAGLDDALPADDGRDRTADAWPAVLLAIAARWQPADRRDLVAHDLGELTVVRDAAANHWLAASPCGGDLPPDCSTHRPPGDDEAAFIAAEAAHLGLRGVLDDPWLTPARDATLSAATSLLLRRTAIRLPGLGHSGPAYLARQFFAQPAIVERTPKRLTVALQGGPLAVVLRMAVLPVTLDVPWLDRPLELALGEVG